MNRAQSFYATTTVFMSLVLAGATAACSGGDGGDGVNAGAQGLFQEQPGAFPREGECNLDDPALASVSHRVGRDHNIGPNTLKGFHVPEPSTLSEYVRSRKAAVALGKALFWDMQVGSDGVQSCGTCHFRAGADPRSRNQIQPGGINNANASFDHPPNSQLSQDMYPFTKFADPMDRKSTRERDSDDVTSSQGVFYRDFVGVVRGASHDITAPKTDAVFNVGGIETRRNEPRNTPTVLNAIFNYRQFWDGRAQFIFNGVSPFGVRDEGARVLRADEAGGMSWTVIRIDNASLASQAVGPPLSDREMGSVGRTFQDVGQRLVSAKPLRIQKVHYQDSVLAPYIDHRHEARGLNGTYGDLVEEAFEPRWWDSNQIVVKDTTTGATSFATKPNRALASNEYTMMEWNFSLFFGLAIQLYEATLVTDDAKIDKHFDRVNKGKTGILSADELAGMAIFEKAGCKDCHMGPVFTSATVMTYLDGFDNPTQNPTFQPPEQVERMPIGTCEVAVYDQAFYNLGVRPTEEDLGLGNDDPWGNPLSIARIVTNQASITNQELKNTPVPSLLGNGTVPAVVQGERTSAMGTFKMPSLRNVALTAPYFHNGGKRTLREVVEFYNRGGDFHDHIGTDGVPQTRFMDLGVGKLDMTDQEIDQLVKFLETLTDQRVVAQTAPFDHPELFVPNGHFGDSTQVFHFGSEALTNLERIPEVGKRGGHLPRGFLE